ncbi:MAG: TIGR04283 family arsenosugar biosynthesis glycosyltransferase [Chitinophagaceae bacterium]
MFISVIIPALNEEENICGLIVYLKEHGGGLLKEIIVADGGSIDNTVSNAEKAGASVILCVQKGRAAQMNNGASAASEKILYFVHADVYPPKTFANDILTAVENQFDLGRYFMKFKSRKWILKLNAFITRFDLFACYGGDQTLFITRTLFDKVGGFDSSLRIMEDFEFTSRARKFGRYKIFQKSALISARKYETNSWLKVQRANYTVIKMYQKGASQEELIKTYKQMLNYR